MKEKIQEVIDILDPKGVRHVPSGTPGEYQEALTKLYAIVDAPDEVEALGLVEATIDGDDPKDEAPEDE